MTFNKGVHQKTLIGVALSIPILLFLAPIITSGRYTILGGDYDMQVQMTEAARISILEYKQFPWFNPWVSGGVPLFADPQFGLFSLQMVFSLMLGSVVGWKIYIVLVYILGFFGMLFLLKHTSRPKKRTGLFLITVLSYAWIFNSFFVYRSGGHLTFLLLMLLPWAIYFYLKRKDSKLYSTLLVALLVYSIYSAVHYPTIMILLIVAFLYFYDLVDIILQNSSAKKQRLFKHIRYGSLVFGITIFLSIPRLYFTLSYLSANSVKRTVYEKFIGFQEVFFSLFAPPKLGFVNATRYTWGPFEASAYAGFFVFVLAVLSLGLLWRKRHALLRSADDSSLVKRMAILASGAILIGSGGVFFAAMQKLPVFSSMRVSTRWLFVSITSIIILTSVILCRYSEKQNNKRINIVIAAAFSVLLIEVFLFNSILLRDIWNKNQLVEVSDSYSNIGKTVDQEILWLPNNNDGSGPKASERTYFALTQSTIINKGQVIADNALVDTRFIPTTRCDKDSIGCLFVSNNARIERWSPNEIEILRISDGDIILNINAGRYWIINAGQQINNNKVTDTSGALIIPNDGGNTYNLQYNPIKNPR